MPNLNKILLMGHLGGDPVLQDEGTAMCKFSLATTEKWKNKEGEPQEKTTWHNIIAWGKQAEILDKYLVKGSPVYLEGTQQHDSYDKDGETKYWSSVKVHNFQFLGGKSDDDAPKKSGKIDGMNDKAKGDDSDLPF